MSKFNCHTELISASDRLDEKSLVQGDEENVGRIYQSDNRRHSNADLRIKKAFTLAEVLITLVVIGIVAAIAVPTLVTRYQKVTVANQVKKAYSAFNQAIRMSEIENGPFPYWEFEAPETPESANELFDKYLSKYFNTIRIQRNIEVQNHFRSGVLFVLQDGSQAICGYAICTVDGCFGGRKYACVISPRGIAKWNTKKAYFKDHGFKYPTREMFWFVFDKHKKVFRPADMWKSREENIQGCMSPKTDGIYSTSGNGYSACSALLMKDGWEFKDDYPWNIKL